MCPYLPFLQLSVHSYQFFQAFPHLEGSNYPVLFIYPIFSIPYSLLFNTYFTFSLNLILTLSRLARSTEQSLVVQVLHPVLTPGDLVCLSTQMAAMVVAEIVS